jgi:hypothetical protein
MFVKDRETERMMVVSGGEDGKITGWDMNSQELKFSSQVADSISTNKQMLISTLDYDHKLDLIGASGNFKGFYVNKMRNL